jgi:LPXTG-motif cell wall-anchored protein
MTRARTVAIVLTAAALCSPASALGQGTSGAGDEQYADPFENVPEETADSQAQGSDDGLSQDPDLGTGTAGTGSTGSTGTSGTTDTSGTTSSTGTIGSTGALPNTGSDPRQLILAGLALLLSGLGLRLRTADEVF